MRLTEKKKAILAILTPGGPHDFLERGTPPYSAALIAQTLQDDLSNVMKTLKAMEADGLVVREMRKVNVFNAIAGQHRERICACFWTRETMEQDKAAADEWHAGAKARSDAVFERKFGKA
jgi:hypothetical protein